MIYRYSHRSGADAVLKTEGADVACSLDTAENAVPAPRPCSILHDRPDAVVRIGNHNLPGVEIVADAAPGQSGVRTLSGNLGITSVPDSRRHLEKLHHGTLQPPAVLIHSKGILQDFRKTALLVRIDIRQFLFRPIILGNQLRGIGMGNHIIIADAP